MHGGVFQRLLDRHAGGVQCRGAVDEIVRFQVRRILADSGESGLDRGAVLRVDF